MKRASILLFVLAVLPLALFAQEKSTPRPRGPMDTTPIAELPPGRVVSRQDLGQMTTLARLANGMAVIVREHRVAPVATARVYVSNTGSAYEGQYLGAGISHLCEHLVSGTTTKKRPQAELEKLLNSIGASSNAYTSTHVTAYHVDVPARHIKTAIQVLADHMQYATFPEDEFKREYHVVQRELEMGQEERDSVMWQMLSQLAYREHPLRHPIVGYLHVLQSVTRDDVIRFYKERYQPQNMTFVIAGDVNTDDVLAEVSKQFATFRRATETNLTLPPEQAIASPRQLQRGMEGELTDATLAWPTVSITHPDLYALDVASYILGTGDSSRLARKLRFEQNLVVDTSASSYTPAAAPGWFGVSMSVDPKNLDKARAEAFQEVYRLREKLVAPEELAKAKKLVIAADVFGHQSVEQIAESLSSSYRDTGDPLFASYYAERIQKVTAEDIRRVAQTYFVPERVLQAIVNPLEVGKQPAATARKVEDGKVQKHVLPNGTTVLIMPSKAVPLVHLQCYVKAGTLGETDATNGVADLTATLMTRGTRKYTADQIADFFDGIGGTITSSSGRNLNYVTCRVLKEDMEPAFDRFSSVVLQPTFPQDEFEARKEEALLFIGQRKADTFAEAMELFHDTLPKDCALRRMSGGRKDTVSTLTPEDCRKFHARYFVPQNMVITIFGDLDPDRALAMATDRFGSLPKAQDFKMPPARGLSLASTIVAHRENKKPDTAVAVLGFPTTDVFQAADNAALAVLKTIVAGGDNAGGWLFDDLRGAGLVYVVQGANAPALVPGYFAVIAQTRPDQLEEALRRIKGHLARAQRGEFTPEEVARAKEHLINSHARENETLGDRAFLAGSYEALGLGHNFDSRYEQRIAAVTVDDVKRVAGRFLTQHVQATTGPRPATPR